MLPAVASATTFCVHSPPECVGTEKSKLQEALNAANANGAGRDEIRIGTGLFNDGPAVDLAGNPVDLIGVASNKTAIYSSQTTNGLVILDIQEPTSTVRDLRVHHNSAASFATGLVLAGDADDVLVSNQGLAGQFDGVRLIGGASSFDDSSVTLVYPENLQNRAIFVASGASPAITDSYLEGAVGVADSGEATILRTRIRAAQGVVASGGADTVVRDTEIRTPGPMKSNFQILGLAAAGDGATSLEADRVTAHGDGTGYGTWVVPNDGAGNNADITLEGSVLDGFAADVRLHESGGANASLTSAYSAYDSTKLSLDAGTSHVQGAGKLDLAGVDPGFADPTAGKLWLLHDSPLVDAGDPAFQPFLGFDVLLRIRVRDGDGNGSSVVDIGAHEYQRSAPQAVATAPAGGEVGQALSFDGSKSSDPDNEALTYSWSFDDGTQADGALVQKAFATPGPHTGTLTVTDPAGLSDAADVTLTIAAPPVLPGPGQATAALLSLSDLRLVPRRFRVAAASAGARTAKTGRARGGTRIGFTLSQEARVTFTIHRARPKRRWAKVGVFSREARSGANSLGWDGRIGKRALRAGRYRLTAEAAGANGTLSERLRKRFKILPG
jgi:PKD domain